MKSVRAKLLGAFGIVLVFVVVLAYNGLSQTKKISDFTNDVTTNWLFGIETIYKVNLNIEQYQSNYYQTLMTEDAAEIQQLEEASNDLVRAIDEGITSYGGSVADETDRQYYEQLIDGWLRFQTALELTSSGNAGQAEIAQANEEAVIAFADLRQAVDNLIDYNHDGAVQSQEESEAIYDRTSRVIFFIGIVILVLVVALAFLLTVNLTKPLKATTVVMNRLAAGDLRAEPLSVDRKDEFGVMMESVNKTLSALKLSVRQMQDSSTSVAAASAQLFASSEQNSEAARHVSESIGQVAAGSEEQANTATECGRVIDEMADGVQRIAGTTGEVSEMSQQAASLANAGSGKIGEVTERIGRLSATVEQASLTIAKLEEQSARIGEISGLIGDIAYQTNLLALNAAIEAARAGEHGKGFAVVAGEVRKLAAQSDESSKGIIELITEIQQDTSAAAEAMKLSLSEVQEGVQAVNEAEQAFREIAASTDDVSSRVQEVAAAAEELAASSEEVAASIANMGHIARQTAGMSQQVAATTEEQLASSEEMTKSSQTLSGISKDLQDLVRKFSI
ncbi:methyl-accepting chemotaxis protein [Paenibacillaceae bacterium WGS1546]|uniref:methyl-accepting chemotaxis protein n=1 Tax=Cohnella sp. WGS1546 TaxID=3366810 RepID=UPI00372D44CF